MNIAYLEVPTNLIEDFETEEEYDDNLLVTLYVSDEGFCLQLMAGGYWVDIIEGDELEENYVLRDNDTQDNEPYHVNIIRV